MVILSQIRKKVLFATLFCFCITPICLSQSKYLEGFYITWENDTIEGLIYNKTASGNFMSCTFKKEKSSKNAKFSAEEILGYGISNGKYYISKRINTKDGQIQAFVEFLVDGISNLYFYRDHENYFYIIENERGEIIELDKEELTQVEGEGDVSRDTYRHIRMLKLAFSDCMEIQPQVENADLSHKSLIKLTKNYHNYVCEDQECIVYEKKLGPLKIYLAPVIGVTTSSLQFNTEFFSKLNYEQDLNLTIGIQLNATLTRINERISLQFDLLYGNNDFHGTYDQSYGNFYFDPYGIYNGDYELYINNDLLQSSLLLKYSFTQLKVRPSLGVGILYNFLLNQEARAFGERANGDPPQEKVLEDIYMASNLIGGVAQIGLNYRIFKNRELFTHNNGEHS
jgi:hypothetical protein